MVVCVVQLRKVIVYICCCCLPNCELHPPVRDCQLLSVCMAITLSVFKSRVVCAIALSTLCCTSYWNSLSGELVHDDVFAIWDNADVRPEMPPFAPPLQQLLEQGHDYSYQPQVLQTSDCTFDSITSSMVLTYMAHEVTTLFCRMCYVLNGIPPSCFGCTGI